MTDLNRSDTNRLMAALQHPLRRRLLQETASQESISPRELADRIDEPLSNVSYHVRVLAECGAVALVRTRPVRGSTQHFYCATLEEGWARNMLGLGEGDGPAGESSADSEA